MLSFHSKMVVFCAWFFKPEDIFFIGAIIYFEGIAVFDSVILGSTLSRVFVLLEIGNALFGRTQLQSSSEAHLERCQAW